MPRLLRRTVSGLLLFSALLACLIYSVTWRPDAREVLPLTCPGSAPVLVPGQALKVMTWNIQYLAGKRYVFWYNLADGSGPDTRPTLEDMAFSLDEVARVIRDERPDLVLLQEVDDNAKASAYQNQLALLQERLVDLYPCSTQAFTWKADFVPDWHIFGSVGRSLVTLSRFQIEHAERLQLPLADANFVSRQFQPRPALLVNYLPLNDGGQLAAINTQLDPPSADNSNLRLQMQTVATLADKLESQGTPWLIGGDFNLLPIGQYLRLPAPLRQGYSQDSELHLLWEKYPMIPSNPEATGIDRELWLTHLPNRPDADEPDRTLDYLFHSPKLQRIEGYVRQEDTQTISDHLPVLGRLLLPAD
ncbi:MULTISPECIES: endonuclease/exonuclease/phosphatase family protein [Pseudomonas]|jgi:Metal-dependent hydrolase|uniref:Endonuclease/exonuclease/phosphatase family protein n=2 Tax=Pseudomonas TaxID=286 RepID=A0A9Q6VMJ0_PSEFR|nr:endonuclease/exonuclease/phosphatase family protein [Pseudomonas fragi]MBM1205784.1 endonuclease/exonuclease/phosphatase family protein [Pseudomonas fragi]NNB08186.1 endonuclease/exonuclease/phosphatase family protein [Pseudomonas fragi]PRW98345.1 endonuclease [Pseudomonas fragi]QPL31132.1 endonuclease/exonuclease/phosphatase family protein [Pseudomonas fragi]